jgi:hypothetical protein
MLDGGQFQCMPAIDQFDRPIAPDWSVLRDAIRRADDVASLRRVWRRDLVAQKKGDRRFLAV